MDFNYLKVSHAVRKKNVNLNSALLYEDSEKF